MQYAIGFHWPERSRTAVALDAASELELKLWFRGRLVVAEDRPFRSAFHVRES